MFWTLSLYYKVCFGHSTFIIMFVLHTPFIILYHLCCAFSLYHNACVAHSLLLYCLCCALSLYILAYMLKTIPLLLYCVFTTSVSFIVYFAHSYFIFLFVLHTNPSLNILCWSTLSFIILHLCPLLSSQSCTISLYYINFVSHSPFIILIVFHTLPLFVLIVFHTLPLLY